MFKSYNKVPSFEVGDRVIIVSYDYVEEKEAVGCKGTVVSSHDMNTNRRLSSDTYEIKLDNMPQSLRSSNDYNGYNETYLCLVGQLKKIYSVNIKKLIKKYRK